MTSKDAQGPKKVVLFPEIDRVYQNVYFLFQKTLLTNKKQKN